MKGARKGKGPKKEGGQNGVHALLSLLSRESYAYQQNYFEHDLLTSEESSTSCRERKGRRLWCYMV
jgi:hypothetical protein